MILKKNPNLRLVAPADIDKLKAKVRTNKIRRAMYWVISVVIVLMIVAGTGILISNQTYEKAVKTTIYEGETSDFNRYMHFSNGFIRYSRDGIAFMDKRNREKWIYPCQIQHPVIDINEDTFAAADCGGNTILVFTKDGMKGEIETTRPIEKISVSRQGIISAILKNQMSPMVMLYDATGNILVEQQISVGSMGYPTALALSKDGMTLGVSYLQIKDGVQKSKIVFYNYGKAGRNKTDNIVAKDTYDDEIFPEIHFIDENVAAAVGDKSLVIYEGKEIPKKKKEILLGQEIKSVFYTDTYIGFILLNSNKSGYEARLYNKTGKQTMSTEFTGEFTDVKMVKNEIIMTAGTKSLIITKNGVKKFEGDMPEEALEIIPAWGFNRYLVMSKNELSIVYLIK